MDEWMDGWMPLSDSDLSNSSISEQAPVLRIFETDDLPLHCGDFTLQHAIMVRSRQLSEIAGLIDESTSDQPTLKRFSRCNQSMHSRPSSHMCDLEPGSSYQQQQQQQQQPNTCSKVSSRLKTGLFFNGNWTLRGKKEQKMRPSIHDITVVQTEKLSPNLAAAKSPSAKTLKTSYPSPFQQHYQNHQYIRGNSPGSSNHNDHLSSINDHRISSTSSHLKNFTSDKYHSDLVRRTPAEVVQRAVVTSRYAWPSENFTQLSTTNPSIAIGQPEYIIPVKRTIFNGLIFLTKVFIV
ncbi:unnamed protein product [Cercopithifilaria johnstoni]|uniref:Uncharacterized protein n=1 Tax=Cercopithifilaria johnstoni TaxID=2874296 RepID=A0A8J2LSV0_9BILA|nr:unnamed protein product [Cercopithifilaria johnstoni]